jgi:5-methylcytosine-specific restriction endonuclease McrA
LGKKEFLTRDHIHPICRGGKDVWTNVVTACNKCNNKKADFTLDETGMKLPKQPVIPTVFEIWARNRKHVISGVNGTGHKKFDLISIKE